jgi:hypothetical protein
LANVDDIYRLADEYAEKDGFVMSLMSNSYEDMYHATCVGGG